MSERTRLVGCLAWVCLPCCAIRIVQCVLLLQLMNTAASEDDGEHTTSTVLRHHTATRSPLPQQRPAAPPYARLDGARRTATNAHSGW